MVERVNVSPAQLWALKQAADGSLVVAAAGYQVHTSMMTGERYYGVQRAAHRVCTVRGWLSGNRITDAGREALATLLEQEPATSGDGRGASR